MHDYQRPIVTDTAHNLPPPPPISSAHHHQQQQMVPSHHDLFRDHISNPMTHPYRPLYTPENHNSQMPPTPIPQLGGRGSGPPSRHSSAAATVPPLSHSLPPPMDYSTSYTQAPSVPSSPMYYYPNYYQHQLPNPSVPSHIPSQYGASPVTGSSGSSPATASGGVYSPWQPISSQQQHPHHQQKGLAPPAAPNAILSPNFAYTVAAAATSPSSFLSLAFARGILIFMHSFRLLLMPIDLLVLFPSVLAFNWFYVRGIICNS
ncbi:hypothetical protein BX666DRAFT_1587852 [Dichotomocladium elegans]|nr:hypothetical protein BX666DRAFT_1587852 [Dichotomocladium elegans]